MSAIGATGTSEYCIEANWLTGAEKFIMFGSAGSLNKEKTQGKFVVPTEAYRDEGISYHYAPPSDYIEIKNHEKLASIFDELHLPYVKGRVWSEGVFTELHEVKGACHGFEAALESRIVEKSIQRRIQWIQSVLNK